MSTTVSTYLNNIGAGTPEYAAAQNILSKITLAASTTNAAHANGAKAELPSLLATFVSTLIANNRISPATILALVASAAATGGKTLADTGITGNVAVSGSAISITPGTY